MKISPDGRRSYRSCPHCTDTELSPDHIFDCPAILAKLFRVHLDSPQRLIYSTEVIDVARAALDTFGQISSCCTTGQDNNNITALCSPEVIFEYYIKHYSVKF
ncbi:unnamed protein product [Larinioides sclopetarius]|uniref:Uncharacterized protein n=1 Tax=Larinioides sclopetarius TaxID=280406 RepID=A0AAV2BI13_9ARAC